MTGEFSFSFADKWEATKLCLSRRILPLTPYLAVFPDTGLSLVAEASRSRILLRVCGTPLRGDGLCHGRAWACPLADCPRGPGPLRISYAWPLQLYHACATGEFFQSWDRRRDSLTVSLEVGEECT